MYYLPHGILPCMVFLSTTFNLNRKFTYRVLEDLSLLSFCQSLSCRKGWRDPDESGQVFHYIPWQCSHLQRKYVIIHTYNKSSLITALTLFNTYSVIYLSRGYTFQEPFMVHLLQRWSLLSRAGPTNRQTKQLLRAPLATRGPPRAQLDFFYVFVTLIHFLVQIRNWPMAIKIIIRASRWVVGG